MSKLRVAIFGGGAVGGGVVNILNKYKNKFEIVYLVVKNLSKSRDFDVPCQIIDTVETVFNDSSIDVYFEAIGGVRIAKKIVYHGLDNNKYVITANKKLLAENLIEIIKKVKTNNKFGFEAAVGGGIPILKSIQRDFNCDKISSIAGILNGTTNYILSKMQLEKVDFSNSLIEAQKLGYAEQDPSADIGGEDVLNKLIILVFLAFGKIVNKNENMYVKGIERIELVDFKYSKLLNSTIKMIGYGFEKNGSLSMYVSPVVVRNNNPISKIMGATNMVQVKSENCLMSSFVGEGAGRMPTANSMVSDLFNLAASGNYLNCQLESSDLNINFSSQFYIKFCTSDELGVIEKIGHWCKENSISIDSILQLPEEKENKEKIKFVITTDYTYIYNVIKMISDVESSESFIIDKPLVLPIL